MKGRTAKRLTGDGYAFERVHESDVAGGDRVLVDPGELVGVDGHIAEIPADGRDRVAVEDADGARRTVTTGTDVAADERMVGASVVVTRKRDPAGWLGGPPAAGRTVLAVAVVLLALSASGLGLWNPIDELVTGDDLLSTDTSLDTGPATNADPEESGGSSDDSAEPSTAGTGDGQRTPTESPGTSTPSDRPETLVIPTDDDDDDDGRTEIDLRAGTGTGATLFSADGVVPGENGSGQGVLSNVGSDGGRLELADVRYVSYENGRTDAESAVDDTGGDPGAGAGELHEAVSVRMSVERPGESRRYVVGGADSYRSLVDLAEGDGIDLGRLDGGEETNLVVEWRVDSAAGNEIQTDSVDVIVSFRLVA